MMNTNALAGIALTLLLITGCAETDVDKPATFEDVKEETGEAADAAAAYTARQRNEFISEMEKNLDELENNINRLEQKTGEASADAQDEINESIAMLKAEYDNFEERLFVFKNNVASATEDAYQDMKSGMTEAWNDLENLYGRTLDFFETGENVPSSAIEPKTEQD